MKEPKLEKEKIINILFWTMPITLFFAQLIFTLNSTNQIRYEELAESVRNVFWLQNRLIYDGISSNIGWYGLLLAIYNLFGFDLNTAKFVRLIIHLSSLFFLALMLRKYLGVKKAWLPLLTIGLSPALLFFNTLQASYGIDFDYLIISIFILINIHFKNNWFDILKQITFWSFNMIAWLSYPTFIFYLPSLTILYLLGLNKKVNRKLLIVKSLSLSLFSFLLPLSISFLYIKNSNTFLYDPITKSGIFRGTGGIIKLDLNIFYNNLSHVLTDLFHKGSSYYFEVIKTDFSDFYPIISLITVFSITIFLLIKNRHYRLILSLPLITLLLTIVFANFTLDPTQHPGIRRNTTILTSFYILFVITWFYINSKKFTMIIKYVLIIIYVLLPTHHFLSYSVNFNSLKNPSPYQYQGWFSIANFPQESLNLLINRTKTSDLKLSCRDKDDKPLFCRYNETYAAVAGYCLWNKLECKSVLGYDNKTQKFIPISTKLWETYYWPH